MLTNDKVIIIQQEWGEKTYKVSFQEPFVYIPFENGNEYISEGDTIMRKIGNREFRYEIVEVKYNKWAMSSHLNHIKLTIVKEWKQKESKKESISIWTIHNHWNLAVENIWEQTSSVNNYEILLDIVQKSNTKNKDEILDCIKNYEETKDKSYLGKAISLVADVATLTTTLVYFLK